jgi:hypothetical protein
MSNFGSSVSEKPRFSDPIRTIGDKLQSPIKSVEDYEKTRELIGGFLESDKIDKSIKQIAVEALYTLQNEHFDEHMVAVDHALGRISVNNTLISFTLSGGKKHGVDYSNNVVVKRSESENRRMQTLYPEVTEEISVL